MTETSSDKPMPAQELTDTDFVHPYTREYAVEQLKKGDIERFLRWFKQGEMALGENPTDTARARFLLDVVRAYEDAEKLDEALVFMQRAEVLKGVDSKAAEEIQVQATGLRKMIAAHALRKGDLATYHMWVQTRQREMGSDIDPVKKCDFLVERATMHVGANDYAGAGELLKQAATAIRGKNTEREQMILVLVGQFGTPEVASEVKTLLRRGVGERIAVVQKELIAIQEYGFLLDLKKQGEAAVKRNDDRIAELKAELTGLNTRKAKLG